jgi:hypothetical protein
MFSRGERILLLEFLQIQLFLPPFYMQSKPYESLWLWNATKGNTKFDFGNKLEIDTLEVNPQQSLEIQLPKSLNHELFQIIQT